MINKVIAVYAIVDDILKGIGHKEDSRSQVSDAEIITTNLVGAMYFGGNHSLSCEYMKSTNLIPKMIGKSRFNP